MNYPLLSEYIEAIKAAEDNFDELSYLRPVLGDDGLPVMTSGNFAVVFKMKAEQSGKFYAVKCFTKEQEGRAEAYRVITKELKEVSSPYLVSIQYLDKELFVDTDQTTETEFPVLLMDWVEGKTLDKYLRENLDDKYALEMLAYRFSQLAQWLIPQPFAHGDLKPDNILVREDGTLVLVDYDGMYVPAMKGQKARELGSPDFRHPLRTENDFDEHIDDFPISVTLLSLKVIAIKPSYLLWFGANNRLLFTSVDYVNLKNCACVSAINLLTDDFEITKVLGLFFLSISNVKLESIHWLHLPEPDRTTLFASAEEKFIYSIQSCCREPGNFFSLELLETYKIEDIEIDIVDSVYKERVCEKIKELYLEVDLTENVFCMNILWILLNHDYGTWDDSNIAVRESWLLSPKDYFFAIGGIVDSIESGKGEWIIGYNEHGYPYDKEDLKEYHYKTDQMFSLDTVVNVSFEMFKRMRLIIRFLNYGQQAIEAIEKYSWLKEANHFGIQFKKDKDSIDLPF